MAVLVDLERREIRASIRDLAESQREPGLRGGLLGRARAELGSRVHAEYRARREAAEPGFRAEVAVGLELELDGFAVRLGGRIDGLVEGPGGLCIEEVKSVLAGGAELARLRLQAVPEFALQLRLYGLALERAEPGRRLEARLILISLLDASRRELEVELHPEATRARLDELLREAIAQAEHERRRAAERAELAARLVFPYPTPRLYQAELIEAAEAALAAGRPVLAMAPTGIGKTAAALLAGLRQALRRPVRLAFVTAKTTQQRLVESTFEQLCRRSGLSPGELRCLTLRAKEKMCPPGHLLCHPEVCPLLEDFGPRLERSGAVEQLLASGFRIDPDAVQAAGEAHRLCPFALSRALVPEVDLVIGDYNHVYDPAVAPAELFAAPGAGPVVIVDEAHNLFDRARGYHSPFIPLAGLRALRAALAAGEYLDPTDRSDQLPLAGLGPAIDGPALFGRIDALLEAVERTALAERAAAEAQGIAGIEDCLPLEPDRDRWAGLCGRATAELVPYLLYNRLHGLVRPGDELLDLLLRLGRLGEVLETPAPEFVPYAAGPAAPAGAGFGCLCVNPAGRLAERHRLASGTLAMSATLTPLSYYADVLGLAGFDPECLTLPSPFPRENLGVFVIPSVDTTFQRRERHAAGVAAIIRQTVAARAGRYVAYFPSFHYLGLVQAHLGLPAGQVLVQLPGMRDESRKRLIDRFRTSRGEALLLAVMGGIFAEGVDLPGEELIGAVVVGPALPPVGFERAAMQHYFQQQTEQGFAYAMLYPGLQRVIQAAGRVIRGPGDQGVIVLVGRRFAEPELAGCLPEHWLGPDPAGALVDDLPAALAAFWRSCDPTSQPPVTGSPDPV